MALPGKYAKPTFGCVGFMFINRDLCILFLPLSFPRPLEADRPSAEKRESSSFARTRGLDSRFRGNDNEENYLSDSVSYIL